MRDTGTPPLTGAQCFSDRRKALIAQADDVFMDYDVNEDIISLVGAANEAISYAWLERLRQPAS